MTVWESTILPGLLDHSAVFFHDVFAAHQLLAEIAAIVTLCCELLWSLAIVTRLARYVLPPAMVGAHLMIFLSSGILFGMMALVGLVVIWTPLVRETIARRRPVRRAAQQRDVSVPWRFVVPVMAGSRSSSPFRPTTRRPTTRRSRTIELSAGATARSRSRTSSTASASGTPEPADSSRCP
jgi:hypothetical protein